MKLTDEIRTEADIPGFLAALRKIVEQYDEPGDYGDLQERCFGENADDTLDWGVEHGREEFAEELRNLAEKHGVAL